MRKHLITIAVLCALLPAAAQQKQEILDYIENYKQVAIDEMIRSKVPASITLAQGLLETGAGTSTLAKQANNHFGIKCKEEWTGKKMYHDDDLPQECFRVYDNARDSYADHSDFLTSRKWYAGLFQLPITDYKSWAYGLKSAGYATNKQYASLLITYIEDYKLYEYDQQAVAIMDNKNNPLVTEAQPVKEKETVKEKAEETEMVTSSVVVSDVPATKTEHKPLFAAEKTTQDQREELLINGVRAVKARGDEDPFTIAFDYNIDYTWIMVFNDLGTGEHFKNGEYIFLQAKRPKGSNPNYTVQQGETMRDISQKTGIRLKDLYSKNQMRLNDQPYAGEVLNLQEKRTEPPRSMSYAEYLKSKDKTTTGASIRGTAGSATAVAPQAQAPNLPKPMILTNAREYQVQQTDTLYSIARKFNTTVDELKNINKLNTAEIQTGQTLVVAQ